MGKTEKKAHMLILQFTWPPFQLGLVYNHTTVQATILLLIITLISVVTKSVSVNIRK